MSVRGSRQAQIVPTLIENLKILIVGVGGIGSNVAHTLVSLGAGSGPGGKIIIYDPDIVSEENLWPQYFHEAHIGMPKVEALAQNLKSQFGAGQSLEIVAKQGKFFGNGEDRVDVVIFGVDSLKMRSIIWKGMVRSQMQWRLLVDGRMGGRGATIVFLQSTDGEAIRYYDKYMLPTNVPNDLLCGEKATAYLTKGLLPGIISGGIAQWLNGQQLSNEWSIDFDSTPWRINPITWITEE